MDQVFGQQGLTDADRQELLELLEDRHERRKPIIDNLRTPLLGRRPGGDRFAPESVFDLAGLHSGICFVTPNDRHTGRDRQILEHRRAVYEQARQRYPERFPSGLRTWQRKEIVRLNLEPRWKSDLPHVA